MKRALMMLALMAVATPAMAAEDTMAPAKAQAKAEPKAETSSETQTTVQVPLTSTYVKGVQKKIRARQNSRRAKLQALKAKQKQTTASTLPSESALLNRSLMLPVSTVEHVAAK